MDEVQEEEVQEVEIQEEEVEDGPFSEEQLRVLLRIPVQKRAMDKLEKILAATREVLADPEIGRDRFTTGQIAKLAGVAIGTLYRYFPDRFAILEFIWPDRLDSYLDDAGDS